MTIHLISFASLLHKQATLRSSHEAILSELEKYYTVKLVDYQDMDKLTSDDFKIIFIATGGVERLVIQHFERLPRPAILLADGMQNSLAAALEISTWLEVLTPLFPRYFLFFATLANVGKNISWLAGSATRAGIRYGFVNAHNMGDLTAKEGSQTVAITVFGTFLGILLSNWIGSGHMEYVVMSSLCISSISLFCIYRSLHCVSLPTINYQVAYD